MSEKDSRITKAQRLLGQWEGGMEGRKAGAGILLGGDRLRCKSVKHCSAQ